MSKSEKTSLWGVFLADGQGAFVIAGSPGQAAGIWEDFVESSDVGFADVVMIRRIGQRAEAGIFVGPKPQPQPLPTGVPMAERPDNTPAGD
jgi:hypothetical protein